MGAISDVEGLALAIVSERRRGARPVLADRSIDASSEGEAVLARLDYDDATGAVTEAIVAAYVEWDPERNPSLLSHATWRGRNALTDWFREQLGRDTPKVHAWAIDLDSLSGTDEDDNETTVGAVVALAEASIAHAIVLVEDEETAETLRSIVLPITLGYSHAEVAGMNGQTEAWVSARLRKLRARGDLRVPA